MERKVHQLPAGAELDTDGDHIRFEETRILHRQDRVILTLTWGTLDDTGSFVPRSNSQHPRVEIPSLSTFAAETTDHPSPSEVKEPIQYAEQDIANYIDTNSLWPTQK